MSDCTPQPPFHDLRSISNCTQKVPNVKLDPTTRAGAACARFTGSKLGEDEIPIFIHNGFVPSE